MIQNPVLYSFRRCPYVLRAKLALKYGNIKYSTVEVDLKNKPKALLEISPKQTVPVLVLADAILDESLDIMHYALKGTDYAKVTDFTNELINTNDTWFKYILDRYKYSYKMCIFSPKDILICIDQYLRAIDNAIKNAHLSHTNPQLADFAILPFIRQLLMANRGTVNIEQYINVNLWYNSLVNEIDVLLQKT